MANIDPQVVGSGSGLTPKAPKWRALTAVFPVGDNRNDHTSEVERYRLGVQVKMGEMDITC